MREGMSQYENQVRTPEKQEEFRDLMRASLGVKPTKTKQERSGE